VVEAADGRADNPFESAVRAVCLEVPGLVVSPQVTLPGIGRADLVDRRLGIVVECDSFGFHAERADLQRDCTRYNRCAAASLAVVRFTWEDGMLRPDHVHAALVDVVAARQHLAQLLAPAPPWAAFAA
jgi:hypothetical protein